MYSRGLGVVGKPGVERERLRGVVGHASWPHVRLDPDLQRGEEELLTDLLERIQKRGIRLAHPRDASLLQGPTDSSPADSLAEGSSVSAADSRKETLEVKRETEGLLKRAQIQLAIATSKAVALDTTQVPVEAERIPKVGAAQQMPIRKLNKRVEHLQTALTEEVTPTSTSNDPTGVLKLVKEMKAEAEGVEEEASLIRHSLQVDKYLLEVMSMSAKATQDRITKIETQMQMLSARR
uniref:Uncharacterized protein n=1 Tax=Chromera velia CCMP2878 TaxID=1169474 RepID=A0A0G4HX26_9ALVE|eukprot:Cvel_32963.t1-p1 / transcript=Cvel_32963.t1 / gene=Cvel_32963 / organism=Chromera_velia_CCMP2878 / gene_product=hypothetical protein / transcript_product=hypothetical protein / location=Cvel_scaffold5233:865-3859(-) / protein_length=236 / sequence_SO=supercontig / SO=protein_coding / is_pseudo=false